MILNSIINFIKKMFSKEYIGVTLTIIITLLFINNLSTCNRLKKEKEFRMYQKDMYENNITAMSDSLKVSFNKELNTKVTSRIIYLVDKIDELEKYNSDLYNEMSKIKGTVFGIKNDVSLIIPELKGDIEEAIQNPNDTTMYSLPFHFNNYDEGYSQSLSGSTSLRIIDNKPTLPMYTTLHENRLDIKLRYNVVNRDGKYIVNAYSPSSLINFTDMEGVLVLDKAPTTPQKNKSPWGVGIQSGFGLNTNINLGEPRWGWSIGLGITYTIL